MIPDFPPLPEFPAYINSVGILLLALLLDWRLPISDKYHPIYFFRQVAERLGDKVNPDPNRSRTQLLISGVLAAVSAILPIVVILYLFVPLVESPWFVELIIVWLCLGYRPCQQAQQKILIALSKNQKILARDRLSDWVLRDTANLSTLGIIKASIESQTLRCGYFHQAIIFWYLLGGPYLVIAYRLLLELEHSWNCKIGRFSAFGLPVRFAVHCLAWIPLRLFAWSIKMWVGLMQANKIKKVAKPSWQYHNNLSPLVALSQALKAQLGGPVSYAGEKIRRPQLSQYRLVEISDLARIDNILRQSQLIWLIIIVISASLVMIGHHYFP